MGVMDNQLVLCESMSIAASAGASTASTYAVRFPAIKDFKGTAKYQTVNTNGNMCLNIVVEDEDLLAAVDGSVLTFALYVDTDTTPTTGGKAILSFSITENTPTEHPDGTLICCMPLPRTVLTGDYLGLLVSVATQNLSTGKITAWIGPPTQIQK